MRSGLTPTTRRVIILGCTALPASYHVHRQDCGGRAMQNERDRHGLVGRCRGLTLIVCRLTRHLAEVGPS